MPRPPFRRLTALAGALSVALLSGTASPAAAGAMAYLGRTADGWALLGRDGSVVYEAHGAGARVSCLRHAQAMGVLRVGHWE